MKYKETLSAEVIDWSCLCTLNANVNGCGNRVWLFGSMEVLEGLGGEYTRQFADKCTQFVYNAWIFLSY